VCWKKETHGTGLSAVSLKEAFFLIKNLSIEL
jgi:hypothetical protein